MPIKSPAEKGGAISFWTEAVTNSVFRLDSTTTGNWSICWPARTYVGSKSIWCTKVKMRLISVTKLGHVNAIPHALANSLSLKGCPKRFIR